MNDMNMPKIPLGEWVDLLVQWVTVAFARFFTFLTNSIEWSIKYFS